MLTETRIVVLVESRAVEAAERPRVLREMRRNPVDDHPVAGLMKPVDEPSESVRVAESSGRGEIAGDLIAPGSAVGMLGDRKQFDVSESECEHMLDERFGEIVPVRRRAPRRRMHLVDP